MRSSASPQRPHKSGTRLVPLGTPSPSPTVRAGRRKQLGGGPHLTQSVARRRQACDMGEVAMDIMAASIAHENSRSLAGLIAGVRAPMRSTSFGNILPATKLRVSSCFQAGTLRWREAGTSRSERAKTAANLYRTSEWCRLLLRLWRAQRSCPY